jgi:hypothetical protein
VVLVDKEELGILEFQQVMVELEMKELLEVEVPEELVGLADKEEVVVDLVPRIPLAEVREDPLVEMQEAMDHFGLEQLTQLISQLPEVQAELVLLRVVLEEILQVTLLLPLYLKLASLLPAAVVEEEDLDFREMLAVLEIVHLAAILPHLQMQEHQEILMQEILEVLQIQTLHPVL